MFEHTNRRSTDARRGRRWASGFALALAGLAFLGQPVLGHHSFAAVYLEQDLIEIEGDVVEFQYRAPHAWLHVTGQDAFGKQQAFAAEWQNPTRLERDGIGKDFFKVGDRVRIWAAPNRNPGDNRVHLKRIERRRDKWEWRGRTEAR